MIVKPKFPKDQTIARKRNIKEMKLDYEDEFDLTFEECWKE